MKYLILIIMALLLSGCPCQVKTVYIPVPTCPPPPVMIMPDLAVDHLPKQPETADGLKALAVDHLKLKAALEQCIINLEGYRSK